MILTGCNEMQGNATSKKNSKAETGLTAKQQAAIVALLGQPTLKEAAQAAGINETTLWRWLQQPEFQTAYREARREAVRHAIVRLQQHASKAVDTLHDVMVDGGAAPQVRVSAARSILEYSMKAVEIEDLAARLEALEAKLAG
jgi:transposase-like protein